MILNRCVVILLILLISMNSLNKKLIDNFIMFNSDIYMIKQRKCSISIWHFSKLDDARCNHFIGWKIQQAFSDCIYGYDHVFFSACDQKPFFEFLVFYVIIKYEISTFKHLSICQRENLNYVGTVRDNFEMQYLFIGVYSFQKINFF